MSTATNNNEVIRLDGVNFAYQSGSPFLENLTLSVQRGERVCLLGRNGSGKSTLLKLIAGLLQPTAGEVRVNGISTTDRERQEELRREVGFVFQNPEDQIIATTVEGDIAFSLENLGVEQIIMRRAVSEQANKFELVELLQRHPLTLSAGEKQRTALAAVMVTHPGILLLDEPTSFLDYGGRQRLLATAFGERSYTIVGATQYIQEIERYNHVVFLDEGHLIFVGSSDEFVQTEHWRQITAGSGVRAMERVKHSSSRRSTLLEMHNVSYAYSDGRKVIDGLNLQIASDRITAMMGDSGCGKTTLALLLAGLVKPTAGAIRLCGEETSANELSKQVAVLFQFPETSFFADSVLEEVAFGIRDQRLKSGETQDKVRNVLSLVGLDFQTVSGRNPFALSAGERRRVAIASVLVMERPIVVFDETTLGLDWEGRLAMVRLLQELKAAGKTIVLMTHDTEFAAQTADDVALMDHGRIVWQGAINAPEFPQSFAAEHFGIRTLAR